MSNNKADLTKAEKSLLKQAGASDALIRVVEFDLTKTEITQETYDGEEVRVERNSSLQEVKKYLRDTHSPAMLTLENVNEFGHMGGHFFTALWEGDLYDAYSRADPNNKRIMEVLFTPQQVNEQKPAHRKMVMV